MKSKQSAKKRAFQINKEYSFAIEDYWQVEKLELKKNMNLEILLVGAKRESRLQTLFVGKAKIGPVYPVVTDYSKQVLIRFYQPLAFQRLDESFASEKGTSWTGEARFRIFTQSEYLKYFTKVSYGIVDEPILHYCIFCLDDIVSVLTTEPPNIVHIKNVKNKSAKAKGKKRSRR